MLLAELIISPSCENHPGTIEVSGGGSRIEDKMKNASLAPSILDGRSSELLMVTTLNRIAVFDAEG